jgi:hypothetical protein
VMFKKCLQSTIYCYTQVTPGACMVAPTSPYDGTHKHEGGHALKGHYKAFPKLFRAL